MSKHITRGYVEKLQAVRDAHEDEIGHNPAMDNMVKADLTKLLIRSNDAATIRWCEEQLDKENVSRRLRRAERFVPSGILDAHDDFYDPPNVRRPSANPSLSGLYPWNPSPEIRVHPYSYDLPHASEFVPSQTSGKRRRNPHTDRQSRKGGKTRTNKHKKGKKSKKH